MSVIDRAVFASIYRRAKVAGDLPWAKGSPESLLLEVIDSRSTGGRAADLGCGAGTMAVALARAGYQVTGVDFTPRALELAKQTVAAAGVKVELVEADVLDWDPPHQFDIVLDSGCLHGFGGRQRALYKSRLLAMLVPGGDYVLAHFGKQHAMDWRPVGPRRWPKGKVEALFAPELVLRGYREELVRDVPPPIGPQVLVCSYWFRHAGQG